MKNKLKYLDLFAGCGGLSDGFLQSTLYEEVAAVEWLKPQAETLKNRLKTKYFYDDADTNVLNFDIQRENELFNGWNDSKFGSHVGLDHLINTVGNIDVIIGGPPCQAYSVAGRVRDQNGMKDDYRNFLFEHYLNVVERYKPRVILFENVPGMLSAKPGEKLVTDLVKEGFNNIGYEIIDNLKEYALLNSNDFNVPQNRKRVIIVGIRKEKNTTHEYRQELLKNFYTVILEKYKSVKSLTVADAIGDLAKFIPISNVNDKEAYGLLESTGLQPTWHVPRFHNERDKNIFKLLANDLELGNNLYTNSKALSDLYEEQVGSKSQIHRYHVLRPNLPSTTIIAHLHKDGNRFIHYDSEQARTITPREAARIQSFDDDFDFIGTQGSVYQMIGNAVPPQMALALSKAVNELYNILIN